jgi:pimeloyl-ACP methyl ester carboxylesterase
VLVLRGASSDVLSQEGAEEVAALIPDARLATVEKAGHLAAGDNPRSTVNLIAGFLDEQPGAPGRLLSSSWPAR